MIKNNLKKGTSILKLADMRKNRRVNQFISQMKDDASYLMKPKPRYIPMFVWVYFLNKFIKLDKLSIKNVCQQLKS